MGRGKETDKIKMKKIGDVERDWREFEKKHITICFLFLFFPD
jgi:hypothetical protein